MCSRVVRVSCEILLQMLLRLQGETAEEIVHVQYVTGRRRLCLRPIHGIKVPSLPLHIQRNILERFCDTNLVDIGCAQDVDTNVLGVDTCKTLFFRGFGCDSLDSCKNALGDIPSLDSASENFGFEFRPWICVGYIDELGNICRLAGFL